MKKSILITGSTDGIGKLAAIKLAHEGHHLYLHGRNPGKLSLVISEVKQLSKNDNIRGFLADFSDLSSVRKMANEVKDALPKLDVLINNAGIFKSSITHNQAGIDIRFLVNYLAPYLLTHALLPLLEKGEDTRIINLSSAAQAAVSYEAFRGKEQLSSQEAYAQSKLAITMWSTYLAKKLDNISVIALNPGSLLNTKMVQEAYGHHWSSADKGANIIYDLATSEDYQAASGKYYDNDQGGFGQAHPDAYSDRKIEKLILETEAI
ncbi:MAG: SDR family NAD(P)-dependent oxidoreductase, partial [Bacteroidota bacterium]